MTHDDQKTIDLPLLANFVHQLINPLNGVIGTIDNIIDGTVPGERRDQRLRAARAQLEWTALLVRNLAYFTGTSMAPGAPGGTLPQKTCVFPQLIIEAAQFFQEIGTTRSISIELSDPRTQYTTRGSPDLIRQVFMNIFDNAIKYSDEFTKVFVKTRVQKKTRDLIIEVINKGIGFSKQDSARLFEVGFRGKEATERIKSGTGLGLYICKRIIEDLHNGRIEAEHSVSSRTTVFRIRIPDWKIA